MTEATAASTAQTATGHRRDRRRSPLLLAGLAVAALLLAACGGGAAAGGTDAAGNAGPLRVVGQDDLQWDVTELAAAPGVVEFELVCGDEVNHNLLIEEVPALVGACNPGETVTGSAELEAGTYTYVCTVPGHETTMRGTLTVG